MGNLETLTALMAGINGGADLNDLSQFRSTIAQNDPWRMAAAPILGSRFNTSTWSPTQTLAVTGGQAFLGALLNGLGQRSEAAQIDRLAQVLPQLTADPLNTAAPEGVDEEAFNVFKTNQAIRNAATANKRAEAIEKRALDLFYSGEEAQAQARGQILGKNEAYRSSGVGDPDSPERKTGEEIRAQLQRIHGKDFAEFGEVRTKYQVLQKALLDKSATSDLDFVFGIAKVIDPQSTVKESEGQMIVESQSMLASTLGTINKALKGGSALDRGGLMALATRHYDTRRESIQGILSNYGEIASARGVRPDDITSYYKAYLTPPAKISGPPPESSQAVAPDFSGVPGKIISIKKIK